MKALICGGRDFHDIDRMRKALVHLFFKRKCNELTFISGGASGADSLVEKLAVELGVNMEVFPADWNKYGRSAGIMRNKEMIEQVPDIVIAFWNGVSKGTANTLQLAKDAKITTIVYYY